MPAPSSSITRFRPELAGSLEEFDLAADRMGFVGQRVLPVFNVGVSAGEFGRIPVEQLMKRRNVKRAPGAGYSRGNWTFLPETFATVERGAEEPCDDAEAALYREFFDAEVVCANRARDAVLREQEIDTAAKIFNTTTWTGAPLTTAVGVTWATPATAVPIDNVRAAKKKVWDNSGLKANALIISWYVFELLKSVAQIVDRIKYSGLQDPNVGAITQAAMAQALGVDFLIVAGAAKDTANEGQASVLATIWADTMAMVAKVAMTNDIREPCLGRTFHWSGDGSVVGGLMEQYRDEAVRSDVYRSRMQTDEKVLYVECGHLLTNIS